MARLPRIPDYQCINFEDAPSLETPLSAANLNHMDSAILALALDMGDGFDDIGDLQDALAALTERVEALEGALVALTARVAALEPDEVQSGEETNPVAEDPAG